MGARRRPNRLHRQNGEQACPVITSPAGRNVSEPPLTPCPPPGPQLCLHLRRSLGTPPPSATGLQANVSSMGLSFLICKWDSEMTKHNNPYHQSCHREHETCCRRPEKTSPEKGSWPRPPAACSSRAGRSPGKARSECWDPGK